ncbi:uncharacterized protein LOC135692457 [Rhopilema esculentum]|uniref:uncharacterized protein LOC135692457 n=1 Tax=Rhopilema esculentum TaxID=499914 RepID=UPI0031DF2638|eukprot:gene2254-17862_t
MPRNARSRDNILAASNSIAEESNIVEGRPDWLENDLVCLSQSPLEVQLKAILGSNIADSFLHPTIKDKKKVKTDAKFLLSRNQGSLDAHEIWHSLRANSKLKLSKEENELLSQSWPHERKNVAESKILRQIQFSRHRTDLMNRVSQINKVKTKEMLKDFFLTSFDEDFSDIANTQRKENLAAVLLPLQDELFSRDLKRETHTVAENGSRIKFVSEEDCRFSGSFRERLEDIGVSCNIGISMADKAFKSSSSSYSMRRKPDYKTELGNRKAETSFNANDKLRNADSLATENGVINVTSQTRKELWEPLTMEALMLDGRQTINVNAKD